MQLFTKKPPAQNADEARDITRDVTEEDFVPYACHWDPYTIVTRNGEILQSIRIEGISSDASASGSADSDLRARLRDTIKQYITETSYALWIHTIRSKRNLQTAGQFKRDFAGYLDRFWKDRNDWEHQYSNEVYITVVREGQSALLADVPGFIRTVLPRIDIRYRERFLSEEAAKLSAITKKIESALAGYGARRLGVVQKNGVYCSELSSFLAKLITLSDAEVPMKDMDLAKQLTDYDATFGFSAMEARMRADGKRRFAALLTIKEYTEVSIESLETILQIPAEFIISQYFEFGNAKQLLKGFEYQKELFGMSNAKVLSEKTGLQDIFASNQGRSTDYGKHQIGVMLIADSLRAMENAVVKAVSAMSILGLVPMREDIKFEECYWVQLPGNFEFIRRLRPINTTRIGGFANLNSFFIGEQEDNHWGPAVTTLYTATHTPYFFNFHHGDNGHTTLIGPEDAGKSAILNFLVAQTRKFDGPLFYFDHNRSAEIFLRSLGGTYYNPYPKSDVRPYMQLALNPFQLENTPKNREFLGHWMATLIGKYDDASLFPALKTAIEATMQLPKEQRKISSCVNALRASIPEIADLFLPWVEAGEFAAVFDNAEDTLTFTGAVTGFEMGDVLKHKAAALSLIYYLLYRTTQALDGKPAVIVLDEAWALLGHPFLAARLKEWLPEWRNKNAAGIFVTEHVEKACISPLNETLMPQIATQLYLPDEAADAAYIKAFNLNEKDVSYLSVMNAEDRHFMLKRPEESLVFELNLSGMPDILAVLEATPEHLTVMEEAITAQGLQASQWMPKFLEMI